MSLPEFLLARIAEDEAKARACDRVCTDGWIDGVDALYELALTMNPARVLAECAAKRAVVENYVAYADDAPDDVYGWDDAEWARLGGWKAACKIAAAVYADHPDYRDEWKP